MRRQGLIALLLMIIANSAAADLLWMEIKAQNVKERTHLASLGLDIVAVEADRVIVLSEKNPTQLRKMGVQILAQYPQRLSPFDFPQNDSKFHNYMELSQELENLVQKHPQILSWSSMGQTEEQRHLWMVRVSANDDVKPATVFMGGHHAREHVSMEIPLRLLQYLVDEYQKQNPRIVSILTNYEIFIAPMINPDGAEFDIATGKYQSWRKNRSKNKDGVYGVDLNRNYGYGWGGQGASSSTKDETYRGPSAFSEKETQAVRDWIIAHPQVRMLLSYHTFSQLVLWPWGHVEDNISNAKDLAVFENMGKYMAKLNGYKPMKSGDLYLASGDTCDWAYGALGIFAFTFELDPKEFWSGGFYPGQGVLDSVFQKNLEPALYMIESADNPYKRL